MTKAKIAPVTAPIMPSSKPSHIMSDEELLEEFATAANHPMFCMTFAQDEMWGRHEALLRAEVLKRMKGAKK